MTLKNLIFHYIDTKQHNPEVKLKYNKKVYTNKDDLAKKFAEELTENFHKNSSIQKARFSNNADTLSAFEQLIKKYTNKEIVFLEFSKKALQILEKEMKKSLLSVGGIVIFGEIETDKKTNYLFTAILNKSEKFTFDEEKLDLKEIEILENEKLAVASFINMNIYQDSSSDKHYISFIRGLRDVAKYFIYFLGVGEDKITAKQQTTELVKAIRNYIRKLNIDDEEEINILNRVYDTLYIFAKNKQEVTIDLISELIEKENKEGFKNYIQSPDSEFSINSVIELLDKEKLKRLKNFKFKTKGLFLSFDKDKFSFRIENDKIIFDNPPKELIQELKEETK
jgi:nucleoid-associated protein YejK